MAKSLHKKAAHLVGHPTLSKRESKTLSGGGKWMPSEIAAGALRKSKALSRVVPHLAFPCCEEDAGSASLSQHSNNRGCRPNREAQGKHRGKRNYGRQGPEPQSQGPPLPDKKAKLGPVPGEWRPGGTTLEREPPRRPAVPGSCAALTPGVAQDQDTAGPGARDGRHPTQFAFTRFLGRPSRC